MAYHNLNHVLLLALALVLVPTASLAQTLGVNFGITAEIEGSLNNTGTGPNAGPSANTNVTLACGNKNLASGITNSEGRYDISAHVSLEDMLLAEGGQCSLRAQPSGSPVSLNAAVVVQNTTLRLTAGPFN